MMRSTFRFGDEIPFRNPNIEIIWKRRINNIAAALHTDISHGLICYNLLGHLLCIKYVAYNLQVFDTHSAHLPIPGHYMWLKCQQRARSLSSLWSIVWSGGHFNFNLWSVLECRHLLYLVFLFQSL